MRASAWIRATHQGAAIVATIAGAHFTLACQRAGGATPPAESSSEQADPNIEAVLDPADEALLIERINRERREAGRGPLQIANDEPPLQSAVRAIRQGAPALEVLRTAMGRIAERDSARVMGWSVTAEDLTAADVPSAFFEREDTLVAIVIVRYRSHPRYALFYLVLEDGDAPEQSEG